MTPEWLEALISYLNIRKEVVALDVKCRGHQSSKEWAECLLCRDRRNFEYRMETLIDRWADTWAVQLFNIREHVIGLMESAEEAKRA